jgi:hypothetical protein
LSSRFAVRILLAKASQRSTVGRAVRARPLAPIDEKSSSAADSFCPLETVGRGQNFHRARA